jgi:hypothetical protein
VGLQLMGGETPPYRASLPVTLDGRLEGTRGRIPRHAPQLTDYELETIARACRALAHREREDSEKIGDPVLRAPVRQRAQCAAALADRIEKARKQRSA